MVMILMTIIAMTKQTFLFKICLNCRNARKIGSKVKFEEMRFCIAMFEFFASYFGHGIPTAVYRFVVAVQVNFGLVLVPRNFMQRALIYIFTKFTELLLALSLSFSENEILYLVTTSFFS